VIKIKIVYKNKNVYKSVSLPLNPNKTWADIKEDMVEMKVQEGITIKSVGAIILDFNKKVKKEDYVPNDANEKRIKATCCFYGVSFVINTMIYIFNLLFVNYLFVRV
jgi:hypothetical protein